MNDGLYFAKRAVRIAEAALTPRRRLILFRGQQLHFISPYWWNTSSQDVFDKEISHYFDALGNFVPSCILDIGAAEGHFAIAAATAFPTSSIHAFEPSQRQRVLLARNVKLNRVTRIHVEKCGLWNSTTNLPFRTVGAESSVAPASRFQGRLGFPERVDVTPLDQWVGKHRIGKIELIKMDAEGAELEILEGAEVTLKKFHPRLLVQAYHLRDGKRTFERCANVLEATGYRIREFPAGSGLLVAE